MFISQKVLSFELPRTLETESGRAGRVGFSEINAESNGGIAASINSHYETCCFHTCAGRGRVCWGSRKEPGKFMALWCSDNYKVLLFFALFFSFFLALTFMCSAFAVISYLQFSFFQDCLVIFFNFSLLPPSLAHSPCS